jgi:hypothetical protein
MDESGRNNMEHALDYLPSEEDELRFDMVRLILTQAREAGIRLSVFGGYGLDGLYGRETRSHDDLDMFVDDESYDAAKKLMINLGAELLSEDEIKVVYTFSKLHNFKVEFAKVGVLKNYSDQDITDFLPENENASISGFGFLSPNLAGQKAIIEIETEMARKNDWLYPDQKITNRAVLLSVLERREEEQSPQQQ